MSLNEHDLQLPRSKDSGRLIKAHWWDWLMARRALPAFSLESVVEPALQKWWDRGFSNEWLSTWPWDTIAQNMMLVDLLRLSCCEQSLYWCWCPDLIKQQLFLWWQRNDDATLQAFQNYVWTPLHAVSIPSTLDVETKATSFRHRQHRLLCWVKALFSIQIHVSSRALRRAFKFCPHAHVQPWIQQMLCVFGYRLRGTPWLGR